MSIWVELPGGLDAAELLVKAQDRGVIFAPSRYFYFQHPELNAFRFCFTSVSNEQIERGVAVLGELLQAEVLRTVASTARFRAALTLLWCSS